MEKKQKTTYTLSEAELKDAVRRYCIDRLNTNDNFSEKDIELDAEVDRDSNSFNFTATLTIINKTEKA